MSNKLRPECASARTAATLEAWQSATSGRSATRCCARPPSRSPIRYAELRGKLVDDLTETLANSRGAGLAAPQIGVSLRVFAINPDLPGNELRLDHLVNPVLEFPDEEEQDGPEGCRSFPGIYLDTKRRLNRPPGYTKLGDPVQVVGARDCSPGACSTRPTTSTACCSSTGRTQATRKQAMKEIRDANWDAPVKISPHRMTDRIF